ncbi:MAG: UDP-N-acetylmuramate--L-alanine ligase [Bdellovibrionota bacterium]
MSLRGRSCRVHFIGIGGIGMSGIAELLHKLGHKVSGSDLSEGEQVQKLRKLGVQIQKGHSEKIFENFKPEVVVYSNAVKSDNPEWKYALANQVPVIRRAEMLAELMRLKRGIAVAGSHGKTTTTGMVSFILKEAGMEPTVVIGGQFAAIGSNAAWGGGEWLVAESDESDGSFLHLSPEVSIVTNIDKEHLDHYGNIETLQKTFFDFIERIPFYGRSILCSDSPLLLEIRDQIKKPVKWYGFNKVENSHQIKILEEGAFSSFRVLCPNGKELFQTQLKVPGRHNISNAVAAALLCIELGVDSKIVAKALSSFDGVARRFEKKGTWNDHLIYEDYGHHPTEIKATLQAAKEVYKNEKVLVVFQPHRYSRTRLLWDDFKECFSQADMLLTLPIYPGGEHKTAEDESFDAECFNAHLAHSNKRFAKNYEDLRQLLEKLTQEEKLGPIFFLGAGDISKFATQLVEP